MSRASLLLCTIAAVSLAACDDPPKPAAGASSAKASAAPAATTAAPTPTPAAKPTTMPELTVDDDGPYLGGQRAKLGEPTGLEKLTKIVKDLPIDGKPVTLVVTKKAKVSAVAATVAAFGDAGAPKVVI